MRNIEYSRVVQRKLNALKMQLCEKFDDDMARKSMAKILRDIHHRLW